MNIIHLLMFMPLLYQLTAADCGCGIRCIKYNTAKECTRCCTHSVRRSVPIAPFIQASQNLPSTDVHVVADRELDAPVDEPSYYTLNRKLVNDINTAVLSRQQEMEQLSTLMSNLYMQELDSDSAKERRVLRRTRAKLQHYYRVKQGRKTTHNKTEKDMYQLLELILKDLRQQSPTKDRSTR